MTKPQEKLAKIRAQIEELIDKRGDLEAAPLTREEASGRFDHLLDRIRTDAITGNSPAGLLDGSFNEADLVQWLGRPGFLAETFGAEIQARLLARFDEEVAGTEPGLAAPERRQRLKALDNELVALEAAEENEIVKLLAEGVDVLRRPQADPRHALSIAI